MRKLALFSLLLASGCASQLQSYVDAITPGDAKTIGAGIASFVQARVTPDSGPLAVEGPATDTVLVPEVKSALERAGYKIHPESARHWLRYQVVHLDKGVLVRLALDGADAARFYQSDAGKLTPAGPFTFREAAR